MQLKRKAGWNPYSKEELQRKRIEQIREKIKSNETFRLKQLERVDLNRKVCIRCARPDCKRAHDQTCFVNKAKEDNGEVFFGEYLLQQRNRNQLIKEKGIRRDGKRCPSCKKCGKNQTPIREVELFYDAVEEQKHDAAEEEEFMEQMHEDRQDDEYETFCNEDNWDRSDDDEAPSNKSPLKQPTFESSEYVPIAALPSRIPYSAKCTCEQSRIQKLQRWPALPNF